MVARSALPLRRPEPPTRSRPQVRSRGAGVFHSVGCAPSVTRPAGTAYHFLNEGRTSSKWEKEVAREPSDPWESEKARKIPRKGERKGGWVRGDLAAAPLTFAPTHTDAA